VKRRNVEALFAREIEAAYREPTDTRVAEPPRP